MQILKDFWLTAAKAFLKVKGRKKIFTLTTSAPYVIGFLLPVLPLFFVSVKIF